MNTITRAGIFALSLIPGFFPVQTAQADRNVPSASLSDGGNDSLAGRTIASSVPLEIRTGIEPVTGGLSDKNTYVEDDGTGQRILFTTSTAVRDFNWIAIGYTKEDMRPYAKTVLHSSEELSPGHPFTVTWKDTGTLPHRGISYRDENGQRRYFTLNGNTAEEDGNGKFLLREFSNNRTFTDTRDGKTYRMVAIGEQIWMAENLNYPIGAHYCYQDLESNCNRYGRLYSWETAQYACPEGWRLPALDDWLALVETVKIKDRHNEAERLQKARGPAHVFHNIAGTVLKSETGWIDYKTLPMGTDDFGFAALAAGTRDKNGSMSGAGRRAHWWTTNEHDRKTGKLMQMNHDNQDFVEGHASKTEGLSVRCIRKADDVSDFHDF